MKRKKTMSENVMARIALVFVSIASLIGCSDNIGPLTTRSAAPSTSNELNKGAVSKKSLTQSTTTGFQGRVFIGSSSQTIPNAVITFSNASGTYVAVCDAYGIYKIALDPGGYYASVTASGYQSYYTSPGVGVVTGNDGFETFNFFLSNSQVMGFNGGVYDASTFANVQNAVITYVNSNDARQVFSTFATNGFYSIDLPLLGGYYTKVSAPGYTSYDSTPGLYVLNSSGFHTGNFFMNP